MNSKRLKELHPEVYKKFFTENELVLSMPLSMDLCGCNHVSQTSSDQVALVALQKLPIRIYIGLTAMGDNISAGEIISYNDDVGEFVRSSNAFQMGGFFTELFRRLNISYSIGLRINILCESSSHIYLYYHSVIVFLVLLSICYVKGDIEDEDISSDLLSIPPEQESDKNPLAKIFWEALNLNKELHGQRAWSSKINGFISNDSPLIGYLTSPKSNKVIVPQYFFIGSSSHKGAPGDYYSNGSFDIVLLYTGIPCSLNTVIQSIGSKFPINTAEPETKVDDSAVSDNVLHLNRIISESFSSQDSYNGLLNHMNISIIKCLIGIGSRIHDFTLLPKLINCINKLQYLYMLFVNYSPHYASVLRYVNHFLGADVDRVGVLPNDVFLSSGVVSIISPLESNRKKVHQMVEEYRKMYPDSQMSIIYESRKDGYEYEGVKVEQDIRSGIFSDFIERGNCIIQHYDGSTQLIEHSQIALQTYDDIIVDTIHHKIYLPGHKLTSKDLHTQTSTSEILEIALQNLDTDIPNTKLPVGAYAKNKNDMTAKIIIPLKKLVEKYCDKDLMFTCSGSLTSFSIRLSPGKVRFGIVRALS